jgi:molybdopterin biosynthesis enzyme
VRRSPDRDELVRARSRVEDGRLVVDPVTGQDSHMIVRAAAADMLALVRRGEGEAAAGSTVSCVPL